MTDVPQVRGLLLDFDGPVCDTFAGLPASEIAQHLTEVLAAREAPTISTNDPMEVLRHTAATRSDLVSLIDAELTTAERKAVETAVPTPGTDEVLNLCRARGIQIAIVSNNAQLAVRAYFDQHYPSHQIVIFGRVHGQPELMKPNPHVVLDALRHLQLDGDECLFVGDTVSDVAAGRGAGVHVFGYANRPYKINDLAAAGAVRVITDMQQLLAALSTREGVSTARPLPDAPQKE